MYLGQNKTVSIDETENILIENGERSDQNGMVWPDHERPFMPC